MAWTDLTFAFESVLTSTQMTNLDANFDALAAGDAGAPRIERAALKTTTGSDTAIVTGTAGSAQEAAEWNSDGDLVGSKTKQGFQHLSTKNVSSAANVVIDTADIDFTAFDQYVVQFQTTPTNDNVNFRLHTSTDGGSSFDTSSGDYRYAGDDVRQDGTTNVNASQGDTEIQLCNAVSFDSGHSVEGIFWLRNPGNATTATHVMWQISYLDANSLLRFKRGSGIRGAGEDVDGIRFTYDSGNINGTFRIYGITNG